MLRREKCSSCPQESHCLFGKATSNAEFAFCLRELQILVVEWQIDQRFPLLEEGQWRLGHAGCIGVCEMEGNSKQKE